MAGGWRCLRGMPAGFGHPDRVEQAGLWPNGQCILLVSDWCNYAFPMVFGAILGQHAALGVSATHMLVGFIKGKHSLIKFLCILNKPKLYNSHSIQARPCVSLPAACWTESWPAFQSLSLVVVELHYETWGLYIEFQVYCAVFNFGQSFTSFEIFGLDKHLKISSVRVHPSKVTPAGVYNCFFFFF